MARASAAKFMPTYSEFASILRRNAARAASRGPDGADSAGAGAGFATAAGATDGAISALTTSRLPQSGQLT